MALVILIIAAQAQFENIQVISKENWLKVDFQQAIFLQKDDSLQSTFSIQYFHHIFSLLCFPISFRHHIIFQFGYSMKQDLQPHVQNQPQSKQFSEMSPLEQDKFLKQEIGKRIRQNELSKIRNMTISEVNNVIDRDVQPPMDQSRANRIRLLNMKMGVTEDMLEHSIKTPGEKHLEMIEKSESLRRVKLAEYRKDPIMAQIKRGKLGVDNFFILFGIFGSLMIPVYIYNKFRKHREEIVASRIASPEIIRRLDEDSPISLEDVTIHEIKYYNPERVREEDAKKKIRDQREKLQRELYF